MSLFSGISNALKSAGSAVANYIAPKTSAAPMSTAFTNTQAPFLLSGTTNTNALPQPKSSPTVSAGNVISAGGVRQSSFGGSGAVLNADSAGYSYSPGVSTGGTGLPRIPSPNQLTTSSGSYNLAPTNYFTGNNTNVDPITGRLLNPTVSGVQGASGSSTQSLGTSPSGGFTSISGGQGLLPGSIGSVSRGGFGMGAGQISGTKMLQGDTTEKTSVWDTIKGAARKTLNSAFPGLVNAYDQGGVYGGTLGKQTIPLMPNSPLARGATSAVQNSLLPAAKGVAGAAATGVAGLLGAGATIGGGITGWQWMNDIANAANGYFANSKYNPLNGLPFNPGTPPAQIPANGVRDAQGKDTTLSGGGTVTDLQQQLSSDTISTLDSIYKLNASNGKTLDISSLFGGVDASSGLDGMGMDAQTLESQIPPEERQGLQQMYDELQKSSGIVDGITQLKDVETQMSAIEQALTAQKDAVMSDPDFSLATKEGRINYIFNNSMEARTYEALTARAKVLGDFIDRQNELIKTKMGFAQQDFQNALAYQQATQPGERKTQVVEVNGQQVLIDSQTGEPISTLGAKGTGAVDLTKDDRYNNYRARETQWNNVVGTVKQFAPQGFNPADASAWQSVDWKALGNNKPAVEAIANAVTRMANPDLTRMPGGTDPLTGESIINKAKLLFGQLIEDQNALPQKLQEAVGQAIVYWNSSQNELRQAQSESSTSGGSLSSDAQVDTTAFTKAAKAAGYSDAQIQQYLSSKGGNDNFQWESI